VDYLIRLHADLGGRIKAGEAERVRLATDRHHFEAVLKMFDREFNVRAIAARHKQETNPWVQAGSLEALRTSAEGRHRAPRTPRGSPMISDNLNHLFRENLTPTLVFGRVRNFAHQVSQSFYLVRYVRVGIVLRKARAMRTHFVMALSVFALLFGASLASRPAANTLVTSGEFHQPSIVVEQLSANAKDLPVQSFDAF
jgi:hypothetical protein